MTPAGYDPPGQRTVVAMNPAQDEWTEYGAAFCTNPACELHVRVGEPGVSGVGNWATCADGHVVGRARYGGRMLCDDCGREWNAGRLRLTD